GRRGRTVVVQCADPCRGTLPAGGLRDGGGAVRNSRHRTSCENAASAERCVGGRIEHLTPLPPGGMVLRSDSRRHRLSCLHRPPCPVTWSVRTHPPTSPFAVRHRLPSRRATGRSSSAGISPTSRDRKSVV